MPRRLALEPAGCALHKRRPDLERRRAWHLEHWVLFRSGSTCGSRSSSLVSPPLATAQPARDRVVRNRFDGALRARFAVRAQPDAGSAVGGRVFRQSHRRRTRHRLRGEALRTAGLDHAGRRDCEKARRASPIEASFAAYPCRRRRQLRSLQNHASVSGARAGISDRSSRPGMRRWQSRSRPPPDPSDSAARAYPCWCGACVCRSCRTPGWD